MKSSIRGMFFYLYLIMDIWSRKITGWAVHNSESAALAAELWETTVTREQVEKNQLIAHSDRGASMMGATLLAKLDDLKVTQTLTRPRVPDDNPYSESLFHTLKQRPEYPDRPFQSLEAARDWVRRFVEWYNHEHLHSAIRFIAPADRHAGLEQKILQNRKEVYEKAKTKNPKRWTQNTRNWESVERVVLNKNRVFERQERST